ncbi:MAG: lysylphosphatidylglycerol synthase transmembrane domain-containing protein [Trueperaceae bacterium]
MKRTVLPALALSLLLSAASLIFVGWRVGGIDSFLSIRDLDPLHVLLAVAALYASFALSAIRLQLICRLLGHTVRHRHALRSHLLGLFGSIVTPGGSGGAPALAISLDLQGVERTRAWAAALATISADVVFHAWATPLALAVLYAVGLYPRTPLWTVLAVGAVASTGLLAYLLLFKLRLLGPLLRAVLLGPLLRFRRHGLRFAARFLSANELVTKAPRSQRILLQVVTALAWFSMFTVLLFVLSGLGVTMNPVVAIAGQTVIMVITSVFPTPGGSGFLELALSWFLVSQGSSGVVTAAIFTWRLLTFYSIFLIGPLLGGYLIVRLASRMKLEEGSQASR